MTAKHNSGDKLEEDLLHLGLLDKAHEIYVELGARAVVSYIKSSYRLLSKVYHPDLNPAKSRKAKITQQVLSNIKDVISRMTDKEMVDVIKRGLVDDSVARNRILIVEDEAGVQRSLRRILTMEGYDSKIAVDGIKGFEEYRSFKPRLVLCDIVMPEMNGLELISEIRKIDLKVKVIYMSGFFDITPLHKKIEKEVMTYGYRTLEKPFRPSEILSMIRSYLNEDAGEHKGVSTVA